MVNVIYRGDKKIDITSFNSILTYDLTDVRFFIPNTKTLSLLYCILKDSNGNVESINLTKIDCQQKNYFCYIFNISQSISVISGELKLFIFGIYNDNSTLISDEFSININIENFTIANQIYMVSQLNNSISNYYNRIVQLTKMNLDILSDMKELQEKGGKII